MTEDKKYYVPEPEEFHKGFRFEILGKAYEIGGLSEWVEKTFGNECIVFLSYSKEDYAKFIRVKSLDRKDIESLGWLFQEGVEPFIVMPGGSVERGIQFRFENYGISYYPELAKMTIFCLGESIAPIAMFTGVIKNKSEFQTILRQVGVIK